MTAYSHILTPSNTTSTYSGSVAQSLDPDEVQQQDFCLTTCWASHSWIRLDGISPTGDKLNCLPIKQLIEKQFRELDYSKVCGIYAMLTGKPRPGNPVPSLL